MSVRDNYFQSICPSESYLFQHREARQQYAALYDATQGLCEELTRDNFNLQVQAKPAIITAYHCALKLCAPSVTLIQEGDTIVESHFIRIQYLATTLGLGDITPLRPFSDKLKHTDLSIFREEISFSFLSFIQEHLNSINEKSLLLTNHYAEIYLRLLREFYSKPYEMNNGVHDAQFTEVVFDAEELYVMKLYDTPNQRKPSTFRSQLILLINTSTAFTHQWALSITNFFNVLGDRKIPQPIIVTSFHAHPFFHSYSANFWRQVKYEMHTRTIQETTINGNNQRLGRHP
jgi:hypothetical protein